MEINACWLAPRSTRLTSSIERLLNCFTTPRRSLRELAIPTSPLPMVQRATAIHSCRPLHRESLWCERGRSLLASSRALLGGGQRIALAPLSLTVAVGVRPHLHSEVLRLLSCLLLPSSAVPSSAAATAAPAWPECAGLPEEQASGWPLEAPAAGTCSAVHRQTRPCGWCCRHPWRRKRQPRAAWTDGGR
jgi:hypothetical protein